MKFLHSWIFLITLLIFSSLSAQHISDFTSVNPNGRNATLVLPETHTFQMLIQNGHTMSGGATFSAATDFTGYVPINGSSVNGYLSINNERNDGGVAVLDINFNQNTRLWNVTNSKYVDFSAFGRTARNCSGAVTPWGTVITSEEVNEYYDDINNDGYYDYGWQVELDPKTKQVIDKRWALGRFAHENAVVHQNWRTVYQGTDSGNGYLYKFVADFPADLSSGKLFVYKGSKTGGSGQWIQIPNTSKSHRNNTANQARNVNATTFAGIEDVEIGPDGLIYFTAKNENRIYYFQDSDPINGTSVSFLNKFAGNRSYNIPTVNGNVNHNWGYGNDNLAFDTEGNLWVLQDGEKSHIWVVRKGHTESNPKVEIFATSPSGSEPTGITFSPDGRFIFLSIQHPKGFAYQKDAADSNVRFNTDATIVIARQEFLGRDCAANNTCSTCNDGIQNFAERGVDCGGPCSACESCFDRIKNGNETGIDCGPGCVSCPTLNVLKTDITCNNNKGSAVAQVIGGSGNITYLWSTGDTTSVINNLSSGNYSVKISDRNGNTQQQNFTINQSSSVSLSYSANKPSNSSTSNGSINLNVSGGKSPYLYEWSTGSSAQDLSNLSVDTYSVKVTDRNNCVAFTDIILDVLDCANFEVQLSTQNETCRNSNNGSITALIAGGTAPFNYAWSNGNNTKTINNLSAGNYSVTITDDNGCSVANSATVTQSSSQLSVNLSSTDVTSVDGNDGTITAVISGGANPYEIIWSTNSNSAGISNLKPGSYDLRVKDANGCETFKTGVVENYVCPNAINVNLITTDVTCFGGSNGIINANATGGTTPYNYQWSAGGTTSGIAFLKSGSYNVQVTDAKGCIGYADAIVEAPSPIEIETNYTNTNNSLNNNGTAMANASGGNNLYAYNWSNGDTTNTIDNLAAGSYEVTVTDQNGCEAAQSFTIQPDSCNTLMVSLSKNNPNCIIAGDITATAAGGTLPYTYLWSNGNTSSFINGVNQGTYTVEVKDSIGCIHTASIEIFEEQSLSLSAQTAGVSANNVSDGYAAIEVAGGKSPYTFDWSNGTTGVSSNNLASGNYTVTVTDVNGCEETISLSIPNVNCSDLSIDLDRVNVKCGGAVPGYIISGVEGGISPISYNWNTNDNTSFLSDITAGTYSLSVTDARGCSKNKSISLNNNANFSVNANGNDLSSYNSNNGSANLSINGGVSPYNYAWSTGASGTSINNLTPGIYEVWVEDSNGCIAIDDVQIDNVDCTANELKAKLTYQDINCRNGSDGAIQINVSGGNTPYDYNWTDGNFNNSSRSNLNAGTYQVNVTDSRNCTISVSQTISQPSSILNASVSKTNETYFDLGDGTAQATVNGGTPPYQFNWSTGAGSANLSGLSGGNYSVEVIDANGCAQTRTFNINGISCGNIDLSINTDDVLCFNTASGEASASATGVSLPYNISWTNGYVGSSANGLSSGVYEAYIIDNKGCSTFKIFNINEPAAPLNANINKTDITYVDVNDGTATAVASNGTPPYSYSWDVGVNNANIYNLAPGNYSVTITDTNGCEETSTVTINGVNCSSLNISSLNVTDVSCFGEQDGAIYSQILGGNAPYTYSWSNGKVSRNITGLSGGTYTLNVTGNKGCQTTKSVSVVEPALLQVNLNSNDESFYGENDGSAQVNINGGIAPYSVAWSGGGNLFSTNNLAPGNYSVTITDDNDCQYSENFVIDAGCRKPYNILANGVTISTAIINWTGDANDNIYNIQYRNITNNGPWRTTSTSQNSIFLTGLSACKTYRFGIYSSCDSQNGTFIEFNTGGCNACAASTNLYTINITEESAFLNWDIYPGATYTLYYRPGRSGNWNTYESKFSFAILFGLDQCKDYQWFIKTNCNGALSPNSAYQLFTTECNREGIEQEITSSTIIKTVYPNPATDHFFVEFIDDNAIIDYQIYDTAGKLYQQGTQLEKISVFDIADLPNGLFTLYLKQGDQIESVSFVKE